MRKDRRYERNHRCMSGTFRSWIQIDELQLSEAVIAEKESFLMRLTSEIHTSGIYTMKVSVVIVGVFVSVFRTAGSTDPCSIPLTGYESFIKDVPEDTPVGSVLGKLKVLGGPDKVDLTQQTNDYLLLDQVSRNITLQKALDTDKGTSTIILRVECSIKNDIDSLSIPLMVRVILEDVNDNPPVFSRSHYVTNVTEDTVIGTIIFRNAVATDADQKGGGNDQISYRIIPGSYSNYFDIEYPLYPDIKLRKPLDFETLRNISVVIEAQDNPVRGVSMNSSATLTVNVMDTDDLIPTFTSEYYTGSVNINATRGTKVLVNPPLEARDQDQLNTTVIYQIYDPTYHFLINETTGAITVDSKLAETTYSALIKATQIDNPLRYGIALVQIKVAGLNITLPNGPFFRQRLYETTIAESQPPGTTIMTVPVTVTNPAGALSFNILENISEFAVDQRGNIFLTRSLDYDGQDKEYRFTLEVSDGMHFATTPIHIRIENVNDNSPELLNSEFTVSTERVQGSIVTAIKGQDKDPNTHLQYQLRTHTSLFAINSVGDISITAAPRELKQESYLLVVNVADDGVPQRSTVALVTVKFPRHMLLSNGMFAIGGTDLLAVILGAVAAVLFLIVVILFVFIIRWKLSYTNEKLTKVRQQNGLDPKGLMYKSGKPSPDHISVDKKQNINGEIKKIPNTAIPTNIRENPISEDKLHYGFSNITKEGNDEIHINSTVIPYGNSFNNYEERRAYQNDVLKTFHVPEGSSSGESSDSTGDSNRGLMNVRLPKTKSLCQTNNLSWVDNDRTNAYNWEENLPQDMKKSNRKPKITVYF